MIPLFPDTVIFLQSLVDKLLILVSNGNKFLQHFLKFLGELFMVMFQLIPVILWVNCD